MVKDARLKHGLASDRETYDWAGITATDFYHWRRSTNNHSMFHRRMIRVLTSPDWPPEIEWNL
jgi:hypothetical protein